MRSELDRRRGARDASKSRAQIVYTRRSPGPYIAPMRTVAHRFAEPGIDRAPPGIDDVANKDVVARLLAVTDHGQGTPLENAPTEDGDDARLAMRILPWTI